MRIYQTTQRDQKKDWVQNKFKFARAERRPAKILPMQREQAYVTLQ